MTGTARYRLRAAITVAATVGVTLGVAPGSSLAASHGKGALRVVGAEVNGVAAPLGLDDPSPALSWRLRSSGRDERQSAYRVVVSSASGPKGAGHGTVWDSGVVHSDRSVGVAYGGRALRSQGEYSWSVQVWDARGRASAPSRPQTFSMGVLDASEWRAHWTGASLPALSLSGASWIWSGNDGGAGFPPQTRYFRHSVDIPAGGQVSQAQFLLTADDAFDLYVNGEKVVSSPRVYSGWQQAMLVDVSSRLHPGANTIAVAGVNTNAQTDGSVLPAGPAGFIGRLRVALDDGTSFETVTDDSWKASDGGGSSDWAQPSYDDSGWPAATVEAAYGTGPWGSNVNVPSERTLQGASWLWYPEGAPGGDFPAGSRYFRRTVDIPAGARVRHAEFLATADDRFDLYVNGDRVGSSPAVEDAWKQAVPVDVTAQLHAGANTLAIAATNVSGPAGTIGRLHVTLDDGTSTDTVTDGAWKASDTEAAGWAQPGFDDSAWPAALVQLPYGSGPWGGNVAVPDPADPYLRKEFSVTKHVARARLSVTSLGLYEARLNGHAVTKDLFTPGFTDFNKRVEYQTYDVTKLLHRGDNAIGALLGSGWYSGFIPVVGAHHYGTQPWLYAQLRIEYSDGTSSAVVSDSSWKTAPSPLVSSDIYMGEAYDARQAKPGWDKPGYDDSAWHAAVVDDAVAAKTKLDSRIAPSVRASGQLHPVKMTEPQPGHYVFDFGQNIAGWLRLNVAGPAGTTVTMRHAEVLNPDGTLYTAALRAARSTDSFTLAGTGRREAFEPHFTYHGFRYAELTGFPGRPTLDSVTAVSAAADLRDTIDFHTSDPMLNQLHSNIEWTQRNTSWSFPTDCDQRDERLPWVSGDMEQYIPTDTLNVAGDAYFSNWLYAIDDSQHADGAFPDSAPDIGLGAGNAGWSDAAVTIPFTLWKQYGDTKVIGEQWAALNKYMRYLQDRSPGFLAPGITYGDWLNVADDTPHDVIATAYFAHSSDLMAQMAAAIGRTADAARYRRLFEDVRAAFQKAYLKPDGTITGNTQTDYVMALAMDLLPDADRQAAADHLVASIRAHDMHLTTGFLGTGQLLPVLTQTGHADVAYALIEQTTFPSWGYEIGMGATTIWERWDSQRPDGSFQDPAMNSFTHPALGSVGEWMYQSIGGIVRDPASPGYKHFVIRPVPGGKLTHADVGFDSPYGRIGSRWTQRDGAFRLHVEVPANTTATVYVPAADGAAVSARPGVRRLGTAGGYATYAVGSGRYDFTARTAKRHEADRPVGGSRDRREPPHGGRLL